MVNIMLSLFTPSMAFQMSDDDIFAKYLREVSKPDTRTLTIQNIGEGCWEWMTNSDDAHSGALDNKTPKNHESARAHLQ